MDCCAADRCAANSTYALLEERVPPAPLLARDEALVALTRRYFRSHGPATAHDFAWWSGLTVSDARSGLELVRSELEPVDVQGTTYWTPPGVEPNQAVEPTLHLLPNYDEHVVAYRGHAHSIDPAARDALRTRTDGPLDVHLVSRNGLIVGGWKRRLERAAAVVTIDLLVELRADERTALEMEVEEYGAFIVRPVVLRTA